MRTALIGEAICNVDRSNQKYIHSPYISGTTAGTVNTSGLTGTYSVSAWTTVDDYLEVTEEITYAVRILDFEDKLATIDLYQSFVLELGRSIQEKIDIFVVNQLCEQGSGTYSTPSGGFSSTNWPVILSNLLSKVAGYRDPVLSRGYFLVMEQADFVGVLQSQMASGFNFADAALRNGLVANQAGVDLYVVPTGTFKDDAAGASGYSGTQTWTNSGHRVFGIKGLCTMAIPGGIKYRDLEVTGYTGKEVLLWANLGVKVWNKIASFIVDITVTA